MNAAADLEAILARMDAERQRSHDLLAGIAAETLIYPESGWRFKDVISHITGWETEAIAAFQAHANGTHYAAPLTAHEETQLKTYNQRVFELHRDLPMQRVLTDWATVREQWKTVLRQLTPSQWATAMLLPWSKEAAPQRFVDGMLWHEDFHRGEILQAIGAQD